MRTGGGSDVGEGPKGVRGTGWWARLRPWQQGAAVLGIGVAGFGLMLVFRARPIELEPPPQIPVVTTRPARADSGVIRVRGSGTVRPRAETTVAPQVGGRVVWVSPSFVSGGRFRRGEPLFRVDPADYENAAAAAEADVAQRQVAVMQAEEEVELARGEYERLARREGLEPDPGAASALLLREPQLEAARAALRSAEARLDDARLALERTWVRAPFDGIVRDESVDQGRFVTPGLAVGRIYATDALELVVPVSDDRAALIDGLWDVRPGGAGPRIPAVLQAEFGGSRYRWDAVVDRAETALDEQTRTVDIVLRIPDPFAPAPDQPDRPPLLLGAFAIADIAGVRFDRFVRVPSAGIRDEDGRDAVWAVEDDSLLVGKSVEVIQRVEDTTYVLGDLPDGEPIVVSPLPFVTNGMRVRVAGALETARARAADER